jgi:hypothetical protein
MCLTTVENITVQGKTFLGGRKHPAKGPRWDGVAWKDRQAYTLYISLLT